MANILILNHFIIYSVCLRKKVWAIFGCAWFNINQLSRRLFDRFRKIEAHRKFISHSGVQCHETHLNFHLSQAILQSVELFVC